MGGFNPIAIITAPARIVSNAITHVVKHPLDIVPAAVGIATGNPWLAAAAAGGSAAVQGGGGREIFTSAAMSGLGGAAGSSLGSTVGQYAGQALGTGSRLYTSAMGEQLGSQIGIGAGAYYGSNTYQKMVNAQSRSFNAPVSTPLAPSMEDMRANAVLATRQAFGDYGLYSGYGVSSKYMKKLRKQRPKYGYREWKDLVRSRE